jgi:hypothetical protein
LVKIPAETKPKRKYTKTKSKWLITSLTII